MTSTRHLINTKTSKLIKNKPLLVNIARGPIINEKVLVSLLKKLLQEPAWMSLKMNQ